MSQQMRNGYGFDFPVPVGQSMLVSSITGTYTATIVAGPGKGTALATDSTGGGTYGPYSGGVVIRLQAGANSLIDYDIAVSPALTYAGPLNAGYNSSGDVASAVDGGGNGFALLSSSIRVDLRQFGAVPADSSASAKAQNHIAMTAALTALANTGGTITFSEPYFFSNNYSCGIPVVLDGLNDSAAVTYIPTVASGAWFTWDRAAAPAWALNEEGQLTACGVNRMTFKSDRSINAGALKFNGCDRALINASFAVGFKGRSLELQNTREIVGSGWSTRYCGRFDASTPSNCREDILIASANLAIDTSNLNIIDKFSSVFPFWSNMVFDNAPQNTMVSYLMHVLARGNTSLEANFCALFGGTPGWDGSGNPNNEFASLHVGAPGVASVSNRMWKKAFAESRALAVRNGSYEVRIGSGRFIGGNTLAVAEISGGSIVSINDCAIESAGPFYASISANASTDILSVGAVQSTSTCDVLPDSGTPMRFQTTTTLPAPLETGLDYWLIRLTDGTFQVADSYANAVAGSPVAIDITDTGTGTHTVFMGGEPLRVVGGSTANLTEKTYINNGRVAVHKDETSLVYGLPRTGTTFSLGARSPTNTGEIKLFELRRARMDVTTDQAFLKVFSGGVRYKITRIVAVLRNAKSAAAAVGGIYTAASKGGSQVVANSQTFTPLVTTDSTRTLTLATYGSDTNMADGTYSGSNLYLSLTTPAANAGIADFYIYGTVMD